MNTRPSTRPLSSSFEPAAPSPVLLARTLALGIAAIILSGIALAVLGAIITGILWIAQQLGWLSASTLTSSRSVLIPLLEFIAAGVGIWAGTYGVAVKRSPATVAAGLVIGTGFGFILFSLHSPLWTLGMLGIGWALSIPARSLRTAAIRSIPIVILGMMTLAVTAETLPRQLTLLLLGAAVAGVVVTLMVTIVDPLVDRPD
jgi:energy-converting hydrogenase Eha subunit A